MSLRRRVCAAAWVLGLLAWAPADAADAAEKTSAATAAASEDAPANAAVPGSSISGARRELDAIKALRDPAQMPKGGLPKLTLPELRTGTASPEVQPWSTKQGNKPDAAKKQSPNWLVDAMMKDERRANDAARQAKGREGRDERGERADTTESGARTLDMADDENVRGTRIANAEPRDDRETHRAKEPRDVANPLNRYLGEWLTPRDYAVLKPSLDETTTGGRAAGGLDPRIAATLGPNSLTAAMPTSGLATGESALAIDAVRQAAPRENPFLEALQPSANAKPANVVPLPVPPPAGVVPPIIPTSVAPNSPPPIAPQQSKIPDFAKPAQDEKYFKQLKRF